MSAIGVNDFLRLFRQKLVHAVERAPDVADVLLDVFPAQSPFIYSLQVGNEHFYLRQTTFNGPAKKADIILLLSFLERMGQFFYVRRFFSAVVLKPSAQNHTANWEEIIQAQVDFGSFELYSEPGLRWTREQITAYLQCIVAPSFERAFTALSVPIHVTLKMEAESVKFAASRLGDVFKVITESLPNESFLLTCDSYDFEFSYKRLSLKTGPSLAAVLFPILQAALGNAGFEFTASIQKISLDVTGSTKEGRNQAVSIVFSTIPPAGPMMLWIIKDLDFMVFPFDSWRAKRKFLHGVHSSTADMRALPEAAAARRAETADGGLMALLHDRRLLRTKGSLVSSFMSGATTAFLPEGNAFGESDSEGSEAETGGRRRKRTQKQTRKRSASKRRSSKRKAPKQSALLY